MHLLKWIYHLNCAMFDLKSQEYHIKHKVRKILCFQVLTSIICTKPFLKFIKRERKTLRELAIWQDWQNNFKKPQHKATLSLQQTEVKTKPLF